MMSVSEDAYWGHDLRDISASCLIVRGEHDYLIPPYQTEALHRQIAGGRLVIINSGHAAFLEKPEELVTHSRQFLFE